MSDNGARNVALRRHDDRLFEILGAGDVVA